MRCFFSCCFSYRYGKHRRLIPSSDSHQNLRVYNVSKAAESMKQDEQEELIRAMKLPENKVTIDLMLKSDEDFVAEDDKVLSVQRTEITDGGKKEDEMATGNEAFPGSGDRHKNIADVSNDSVVFGVSETQLMNNTQEVEVPKGSVIQESSESLFSLSIGSRKRCYNVKEEGGEKEVTSPTAAASDDSLVEAPELAENSNPTKPVERICPEKEQKEAVSDDLLVLDEEKENIFVMSNAVGWTMEEPFTKRSFTRNSKKPGEEKIGVDTSLTSWLVHSDEEKDDSVGSDGRSPLPDNQKRCDVRALRVRNDDKAAGIGTIGSYWIRTRS